MANERPVRDNNSIDGIGFGFQLGLGVEFDRPFSGNYASSLLKIAGKVHSKLPKFELLPSAKIAGAGLLNSPQNSKNITSGINCFKESETIDKMLDWELRVEPSLIIVSCSRYTRWYPWEHMIEEAIDYFNAALSCLDPSGISVSQTLVHCSDHFYTSKDNFLELSNVFDPKSQFFSPNILEAKQKALHSPQGWHLHQGWHTINEGLNEGLEETLVNLHNLNLNFRSVDSNRLEEEDISTEAFITHLINTRPVPTKNLIDLNETLALIRGIFSWGHISNKETIKSLLNSNLQEVIGLNNV